MDPQMMQQLLAQLGGGGGGGQPPPQAPPDAGQGDWLTAAINSVHAGMVQDSDPKTVSLLGAILNQLTTYQAQKAPGQSQGQPQGG